ncbi:MAG: polysaccharide deacetylase family protein [Coriobacteriia bacterium]|nr:polysaccharide deacetylase family protein [Coriobacteriia bacterium]
MNYGRQRGQGGHVPWDGDEGFDSAAWAAERAAARERRRSAERRKRQVRGFAGVVVLLLIAGAGAGAVKNSLGSDEPRYEFEDVAGEATPTPPAAGAAETPELVPVTQTQKPTPEPAHDAPDPVAAAAVQYPGAPAVEPEVIQSANPAEKLVAITIDDGIPIDERLLDLLIDRDVPVTTFLLGQAVVSRRTLVKRMHDAGFEIATHGWDHDSFTKMSESEMRSQLKRTQDAITDITGDQAPYFRPPYGARNDTVDRIAAERGYRVVLWDASFVDTYKNATPEYSMNKALKNLHPGSIILCHWGRPATYGAMRLLLDELDRRGYRAVTLSELLAAPEEEMR